MRDRGVERKLTTILSADVAGYSRLMGDDEEGTLHALNACRAVIDGLIEARRGRVFGSAGDSVVAEFRSAVEAVRCAAEIQRELGSQNAHLPEDRRMGFRIGINLGDVMIEGDDLLGDGVNVAARLQELAEPGGISISGTVFDQVEQKVALDFENLGAVEVKNIARPVRAYRVPPPEKGSGTSAPAPASGSGGLELPDKPSIAVLPFENMSGEEEQEYFSDGISEDIITDLSKISGLFVIARNTSFAYKGQSPNIAQVSRDLGVRYVVEGSVRKAGNRVRITAQLIDGKTGGHVWAERFDRDLEDIFAVQDEVTREIVDALKVKLTAGEQARREDRGKVDPEAYDCLVRARTCFYQFSAEAFVEGRTMAERAIALDPGLAPAYALLSLIHLTEHVNDWNGAGPDYLTRALELARKACETDGNDAQAYHALAVAQTLLNNLVEAERAGERSLELDPNFAGGYTALGQLRDYMGRPEDAIGHFEQALRLDPQYNLALQFMGRAQLGLKRYDEAEKSFLRRLIHAPRSDMTRVFLASLYGHTGRLEDARRMWREAIGINPDYSVERMGRIWPYKDPSWFEHFMEGLAKAGLPE